MTAGMKIHFMATGIKDGYLTIMNLLRDKSPSRESGLLGIILQYAGLLPPKLNIDLDKLIIKKTPAEVLKATFTPIPHNKYCRFPEQKVACQQRNGYRVK